MNIVITARKTTVKDSFKERIEKKLAKFDRFFDDATATVVVTNEKDRETVEITIQSMGMFFRAEKTTGDPDRFAGIRDRFSDETNHPQQIQASKKIPFPGFCGADC